MNPSEYKILVVDDTEPTRYALTRVLKSEGYHVLEATNGTDGLRLVHEEHPDLVMLDIHLPDILGFEVCRKIKADPLTSHIPVLQISASFVTSKDRIHGLEGGADSYLTHPCEPPVLLATVRALLRTRQLNEDLRISEERFRVALKYAPIMIYTLDQSLNFNWIYNAPVGIKITDFIGRPFQQMFKSENLSELVALHNDVLKDGLGKRNIFNLRILDRDYFFDMTVEPLRDTMGRVVGLTVACIDVTERLHAEEAQKRALEDAELANQAKTRFLSNMSHEIRTPLGVIQGFTDLALNPEVPVSERNSYLATIKRNAQNLTKLLGEILDLAKIEAGRIEIEKSRFSLGQLLKEIVETHGLHARDKGVALKLSFLGPVPECVITDSTRVRQVLTNLVNNAIKFTERGGVEMVVRALPRTTSTQPVIIEVAIRDTGIGISPQQQTRLFEAFMQADSSTTRKFGGTGLGLNLSKKLARVLGGDLNLSSSSEGRGSVFTVTFNAGVLDPKEFIQQLKIQSELEPLLDVDASSTAHELDGMKVLLVEDMIDNQLLFAQYLKNAGAEVELANDGLEALSKTHKTHYDAILMDVQMPNVDGYEATRAIRSSGDRSPIIALTAHALKEDRERALSEGFTGYLTKPLNSKLLVETLKPFRHAQQH